MAVGAKSARDATATVEGGGQMKAPIRIIIFIIALIVLSWVLIDAAQGL